MKQNPKWNGMDFKYQVHIKTIIMATSGKQHCRLFSEIQHKYNVSKKLCGVVLLRGRGDYEEGIMTKAE